MAAQLGQLQKARFGGDFATDIVVIDHTTNRKNQQTILKELKKLKTKLEPLSVEVPFAKRSPGSRAIMLLDRKEYVSVEKLIKHIERQRSGASLSHLPTPGTSQAEGVSHSQELAPTRLKDLRYRPYPPSKRRPKSKLSEATKAFDDVEITPGFMHDIFQNVKFDPEIFHSISAEPPSLSGYFRSFNIGIQ